MKLRDNINLGAAFETLKKVLLESQKEIKKETDFPGEKYAKGYGMLSGAIQGFLVITTDINYKDIVDSYCINDIKDVLLPLGEIDKEIEDELSRNNHLNEQL